MDAISLDIEKGGGRDGKTTEAELHEGVPRAGGEAGAGGEAQRAASGSTVIDVGEDTR